MFKTLRLRVSNKISGNRQTFYCTQLLNIYCLQIKTPIVVKTQIASQDEVSKFSQLSLYIYIIYQVF